MYYALHKMRVTAMQVYVYAAISHLCLKKKKTIIVYNFLYIKSGEVYLARRYMFLRSLYQIML